MQKEVGLTVKFLCIFHRLANYHCARLKAADAIMPLEVLEISGKTNDHSCEIVQKKCGFNYTTVFASVDSRIIRGKIIFQYMTELLYRLNPTVVAINGWADKGALVALYWCINNGRQIVLMSDSTERDEKRTIIKELIKSKIVTCCNSALVAGKPQKEYIIKLGLDPQKVFVGYDAIDNEYFSIASKYIRSESDRFRNELNLPEKYFLSSNRLIQKKNLIRLLEAYNKYRMQIKEAWHLVLLGDGQDRFEVENKIKNLGLDNCVVLLGFKQYKELPIYYALAKCFILASISEQWGLVVNEAMASGLPVLVSKMCGCHEDLVEDGGNGFSFNPFDVDEICEKMIQISSSDCDLKKMGQRSREIIANWGCDNFAKNLLAAAKCAMDNPAQPTLLGKLLIRALIHR